MPVSGGGFERACNAQAAVDTTGMRVVAPAVTQACNDKEHVVPMLAQPVEWPATLGKPSELLIDGRLLQRCQCQRLHRERHRTADGGQARSASHPTPCVRFTEPPPLAADATPAQRMAHKLTKAAREWHALHKPTVEPVFGIIKSVSGFRQFSLLGVKKVSAEWTLVCLACSLKRMVALRPKIVN